MSQSKDITNEDRANWAQKALDSFLQEAGSSGEDDSDIQDLIVDLLHLAHRQHADIDKMLANARGCYQFEVDEQAATTSDVSKHGSIAWSS